MFINGSGITCRYPVGNLPSTFEILDKTKNTGTNIYFINNSSILMLYLTLVISAITLIVAVMVLVETYKIKRLEKKNERRD